MGIQGLYSCFFPSAVAVIGTPGHPSVLGRRLLGNLAAGGFRGRGYVVGMGDAEAPGWPSSPDLKSFKEPFDLALIVAPVDKAPEILADCGQHRAKGAVIFSRCDLGLAYGRDLGRRALAAGLRLIGPRSWGILNTLIGLYAGLTVRPIASGGLAVISQSAALCTKIVDLARSNQIGLALVVGIGDVSEVDCADILDYVAGNANVRAILLHLEQIDDLRKFMSAARAGARLKPIMVLKTGRGPKALIGPDWPDMAVIEEDDAYDAVFQRAGLVRVKTVEGLFSCGDLAGKLIKPKGGGLVILTNTRSPGVIAADCLKDLRIELAALGQDAHRQLHDLLGDAVGPGQPINIPVDASPELWGRILNICRQDQAVDGMLAIVTPQFMSDPLAVARAITAKTYPTKPLFAAWMGGLDEEAGNRLFLEAGIPTYDTPEAAIQAYAYLQSFTENLNLLQEVPPRTPRHSVPIRAASRRIVSQALAEGRDRLDPVEALQLLADYDIPVVKGSWVRTLDDALGLAAELQYPVELVHLPRTGPKTARGPAARILENPQDLKSAWPGAPPDPAGGTPSETTGLLLRKTVACPDLILRLGSRLAGAFGPVIHFGLGGLPKNLSLDQAIGLPPLNRFLARMVIKKTKVGQLLSDPNLTNPEVLDAVEEVMVQIAHLATDLPEVPELNIEPLLVTESGIWAQQAQVRIRPTKVRSPLHLIICPYPADLETVAITKSGREVFIRPLKPEDAEIYQTFWKSLSPLSLFYRFSRPISGLTQELMIRFTQMDYDREVALAALDISGESQIMLAVARLNWAPGSDEAEFAVAVGDPWQGQGVGAELLRCLIRIAQKRGHATIWGLVLRENRGMIELAKKLGFTMVAGDGGTQMEVRLDLRVGLDLGHDPVEQTNDAP